MMKNGNRILTYALALSLAVHLVFAVVFRPIKAVDAHPEQTPVPVQIIVMHTPPPPTPTPRPTRPPKSTHVPKATAPRRVVVAPRVAGSADPTMPGPATTSGPVTDPPAVPGPSGPPETPEPPTPTPKPACSVPNAPASTVAVVSPSIPDSLGDIGEAEAQVRVSLDADGAVEGVHIYRSAGNMLLDREALRAARQSTYRAEIRDCAAVRGDYLFTVDFRE